ncbi:lytic transglycosylase domain-containing protein [Aquipuribacter nitratireducens]|uniref:Lytic murein transglycosylase n=1 Tax=Aquipuribacter nitratireducens TaxID=650104 RepID=A0ABW0GT40_9MICO
MTRGRTGDAAGQASTAAASSAPPASAAQARARAAHRGSGAPRVRRVAVALVAVASVALGAATAGGAVPAVEQPQDVLAAGVGGLPDMDLEGWRHDASAPGWDTAAGQSRAPGAVPGGAAAGVAGEDGWYDWDTWPDGVVAGADAFGAPFEIPGGEEVRGSAVPGGLAASGIPEPTLRAYRAAAEVLRRERPGCGVDWALLAGIGRVESNHGRFGGAVVTTDGVSVPRILGVRLDGSLANTMVIRDTDGGALDGDTAYDRALGPMQFLPGTWARWGSDGDRDGVRNPQDIDDAALAAARYLCAVGVDLRGPDVSQAIRRYNNSAEYVSLVLATASGYRSGGVSPLPAGGPVSPLPPLPPGWTPPVLRPGGPVGGVPTPGVPTTVPSVPASTPTPSVRPTTSPRPVPPSTQTPRPPVVGAPGEPTTPPSTGAPDEGWTPAEPSGEPTTGTTGRPKVVVTPSAEPTTEPSSTPTPTPSPEPSPEPSSEPSATPSVPPSSEASAPVSSEPSAAPASGEATTAPSGDVTAPAACSPEATDPATGTCYPPCPDGVVAVEGAEPGAAEGLEPCLVVDGRPVDPRTGAVLDPAREP